MLATVVQDFNIGEKLKFQDSNAESTYTSFGDLITNILPNIFIAAGIIVLFLIVGGGLIMIFNSGNKDAQANGQKIITGAIIGLVVLFASYWIVQIIQILTGVPILNSGL